MNKRRHKWIESFDRPFFYTCEICGKHKIKETMYSATYYDENMNSVGSCAPECNIDLWARVRVLEVYPMETVDSRQRYEVSVEIYNGNVRISSRFNKKIVRKDREKALEICDRWIFELRKAGLYEDSTI